MFYNERKGLIHYDDITVLNSYASNEITSIFKVKHNKAKKKKKQIHKCWGDFQVIPL